MVIVEDVATFFGQPTAHTLWRVYFKLTDLIEQLLDIEWF
jgi:ABC-type sulfate transport system permease component